MRSGFVLATAILASTVFGGSLEAAIIGSQGFNVTSLTPDTGSISQSITLNILSSNSSQGGDFTGLATGTAWGTYTLGAANSSGSNVVITSPGFGTFTGTISADTVLASGLFRNLTASGNFVPGTDAIYGGDTAQVAANLSITLTKSSSNSVISATVVLDTFRQVQNIPEPSSVVLVGLGVLGMAFQLRRRHS